MAYRGHSLIPAEHLLIPIDLACGAAIGNDDYCGWLRNPLLAPPKQPNGC